MQKLPIDAPSACITAILRSADLRPTRQRVALGRLLFSGQDRHVTAEMLHEEVSDHGERISLATVYNTLHQFERAGLIRELAIDGAKTYFDTNTSNHNHFYIESEGRVIDIPSEGLKVVGVPKPPEGTRVSHVDVVVRLVKNK
ncbi:MAG: transcriptional repressor [Hyphomicrobiaceae bacterium]